MLFFQLDSLKESEKQMLRNVDLSSEPNDVMIAKVKTFLISLGGTLGDLSNAIPHDDTARVLLDKMLDTWNHSRVVLLGYGTRKNPLCFLGSPQVLTI